MEFSSREAVIKAMKDYTIHRESNFLNKLKAPIFENGSRVRDVLSAITRRTSGNIQVTYFDGHNVALEAREMPNGVEYAIDLHRQHCDCGEFQVNRLPCRHVFACCANQWLDWQLARLRLLRNPTTWLVYHGPRFVDNSFLRRIAKARPRITRFLNEMDTRMLRGLKRCKQCEPRATTIADVVNNSTWWCKCRSDHPIELLLLLHFVCHILLAHFVCDVIV
ncbi:hypothetical protein Ahy_B06g085357 [Arachis hypogaea]|uniref:SWIM-type domain-containing protein n=1 Tax=Arachis hypogaea TaxID=3818 RepID=A0A444YU93_ARAHY|nr:hypothetical protein Ahy_B06g085357 [Arachis hypogaea]